MVRSFTYENNKQVVIPQIISEAPVVLKRPDVDAAHLCMGNVYLENSHTTRPHKSTSVFHVEITSAGSTEQCASDGNRWEYLYKERMDLSVPFINTVFRSRYDL